jgi:hypothetical protein
MAAINLRQDKERPLTIEEVDHNFSAINSEVGQKLDTASFTAGNILTLLNNNAGSGSTLDADKVHGKFPSIEADANTVATRDALGNLKAVQFHGLHIGNVIGDITGNGTGTWTGNSTNINGVAQLDHGGTGAVTAAAARTNLGCGNMAVQNKNAIDITGGTITGITDLAVADGGTGAGNAIGARSNLGLVIGSDVQAYSAILTGVSNSSGDGFLIRTATNTSVSRVLASGNSIEITNTDGKSGNPTISLTLNPTITSLTKTGTNGSGDIGQSNNVFNTIYLNTVTLGSVTKTGTNGSGDIGQADNRFGSAHISSLGVGTGASGTSGEIRAISNITAYYSSDRSLKENIQDIPKPLETVSAIGGKLFDWTDVYIQKHGGEDGYFIQKQDFGVIAQDVQKVFPRAVRTREDGTLAVDYEKLSALAFAALVEVNQRLLALEAK